MGKKVYINGRFLVQPKTGVQRFALELFHALDQILLDEKELSKQVEFICLTPKNADFSLFPHWKNIDIKPCGRTSGNFWEQFELPWHARGGLLFSPCNIGPIFHFNQIVTFHDASVFAIPNVYSQAFRFKYQVIMRILAKTANLIITDSNFSKHELIKYLKIEPQRLKVVYGGGDHFNRIEPNNTILEENKLLAKPYLLMVGSSSPHKNINSVIAAYEQNPELPFNLVIAGGTFSKVFRNVEKKQNPSIIYLGYVTDNQLKALYTHASVFIFPSLYEGFGLPPLEAISCGCPVFCSNHASLPEVCGDSVRYFDPLDSSAIKGFFSNPTFFNTALTEPSQTAHQRLTWVDVGLNYLRSIEYLLSGSHAKGVPDE